MAGSSLLCIVLVFCCVALGTACGPHGTPGKPPNGKPDPVSFFQRIISHIATDFINSKKWKGNETALFVAQVFEMAGVTVPNTNWFCWCPIGVDEWGKANSTYLTCGWCWVKTTCPRMGDVAGNGKIAAIVGEKNTTIYPSSSGVVVKNKVAFQPGSSKDFIFWTYVC
ncbi:hypothetical protein NP493_60g00039 [Ridgeia piscesae]|uniref:Uncharacterized protein n=1 Tax=Ridgeia piscesae TaxID=27915 RepID=A0AAD9PAA3_RIDPI|nr:hypothetical protein NP493_60g00039 [Ridgeia piscesae]